MLESAWVDRIHARLLVRYGSSWVAKYPGIPDELVKHDWVTELSGLRPEQIKHALEHLPPEFPPGVTQFRDLCLRAPEPMAPRLPAPKADKARVAAELQRMGSIAKATSPLQWAYRLQEREKQGETLTGGQRAAWRAALRDGMDVAISGGTFSAIDADKLPPGMRPQIDAHVALMESAA